MFAFFHSPRCSLLSTAKQSHRPPAASGVGRPGCRRRRGRPALVSFFVRFLGLPARVWTLCEVMRTPYTTTAPKTAAATPLPSLGSSDEPMTMWWPLANMLPMVLRIMMAKMEMTTLLVAGLVEVLVLCTSFLLFFFMLPPSAFFFLGRAYHVHALKAETTGFIVVEVRRLRSWCSC